MFIFKNFAKSSFGEQELLFLGQQNGSKIHYEIMASYIQGHAPTPCLIRTLDGVPTSYEYIYYPLKIRTPH